MKFDARLTLFNTPGHIATPKTETQRKNASSSFGWFDQDYRPVQINPNGPSEAIPKESDYILVPIRHLSAGIVAGGTWRATEFPEKVLKKSKDLLRHKPMYVNHEIEISNNVGVVGEVKWVNKKKVDGVEIPGGLEAPAIIDSKAHTDLCRKLLAWPIPHIQSVSVTVVYQWQPSHEFKTTDGEFDLYKFDENVGQLVDGKMVRRVATEIINFEESSFVYLGADPFAKIVDEDGNLMNIDMPSVVEPEQYEKDKTYGLYQKRNHYFISLSGENHVSGLSNILSESYYKKISNAAPKAPRSKPTEMNEEVLEFIASQLKKSAENITVNDLKKYHFVKKSEFSDLPDLSIPGVEIDGPGSLNEAFGKINDQFKAITKRAEDAEAVLTVFDFKKEGGEVTKLNKDGAKVLLEAATYGQKTLEANRGEAVRLYKISVGEGKEDEEVINLIKGANPKQVVAMIKQYGGSAAEEFMIQIEEDGSHSFRQTSPENGGQESTGKQGGIEYLGGWK